MEISKDLFKLENTVVGLGFFDGVHLAHQELIRQVVKTAKDNGLKSVIITFEKSPAEKFFDKVEYITTNSEKESIIESFGVDYLFELDFDRLMNLSAEDYLKEVLVKYFAPKYIYTGFNHTFGKGKKGCPELLKKYSDELGYKYIEVPQVEFEGETISSTRIKKCLNEGDVTMASRLLGREYSLSGVVQKGRQLGRTIGFPTANILYPDKKSKIPFGVYSVSVKIEGELFRGVLNYGIKPTVGSDNLPLLEVNIFDFDRNIYNKPIRINLLKWIREERKFDSLEGLKSQIEKDLKECLK